MPAALLGSVLLFISCELHKLGTGLFPPPRDCTESVKHGKRSRLFDILYVGFFIFAISFRFHSDGTWNRVCCHSGSWRER